MPPARLLLLFRLPLCFLPLLFLCLFCSLRPLFSSLVLLPPLLLPPVLLPLSPLLLPFPVLVSFLLFALSVSLYATPATEIA